MDVMERNIQSIILLVTLGEAGLQLEYELGHDRPRMGC